MDSTNSTNGSELNQAETSWQNEFLKELLHRAVVNVKFIKKDGTERSMQCTLKADLLPTQTDLEESVQKKIFFCTAVQKKTKTPNPAVLAVYDIEKQGWRSFRWDSIIGFSEV